MAMIADLKKELEREAEEENIPILRRAERKLLLEAAAAADPKKILEVGTATGYSALFLAEHFPLAEIDTIEIDALRNERAVSVMQAAGFERRVRCHLGDAGEVLPALAGPYDFVYLDGPKGQYLRHLKLIEPKLSGNAVIAADNVLFRGWCEAGNPWPIGTGRLSHACGNISNMWRLIMIRSSMKRETVLRCQGR